MYHFLQTCVIGGLNIFIQDDVEYINVEGALCPCYRVIKYFIKYILQYINVALSSCLCNRGFKYLYTG
jgi:hypothetical protein